MAAEAGDRDAHGATPELRGHLGRVAAVLLDLDGTLVSSHYDWTAIRSELEISGPSIIDALNGRSSPEREAGWSRMREIEREATEAARPFDGTRELLELLRERQLRTALVTNNSAENTALLLSRFELRFDRVWTRDDGFWKPSGAPLLQAMEDLGVGPDRCILVGDSRFDLAAARDAGCPFLALDLHDQPALRDADARFSDVDGLRCFLERHLPFAGD